MWVLPLGMSVTTEPSIQGRHGLPDGAAAGVFAIKTNPKKGGLVRDARRDDRRRRPRRGPDRVYVGTSSQALYAIDPRLQSGRKRPGNTRRGDRVSGAPPGSRRTARRSTSGLYDKIRFMR